MARDKRTHNYRTSPSHVHGDLIYRAVSVVTRKKSQHGREHVGLRKSWPLSEVLFSATACPATAAAKEAGQAKQVAKVVPTSIVVDLVDTKVASEQRSNKYKRRNETLPETEPETSDYVVLT
jgi:hypothetical protein